MTALPYLLVAEKSVLPIAPLVVESLQTHAQPNSIYVVVPSKQVSAFKRLLPADARVLAEEDILPRWPLQRVQQSLPALQQRAGWYLQQFLKLNFGISTSSLRYVTWDADTVLLRPPILEANGHPQFATAKERHAPYFETFERLFGIAAPLPASVISQYMLIDTALVNAMQQEIEHRAGADWISAILSSLPGLNLSEFSEFETYANYHALRRPGEAQLVHPKWFRYGSEIFRSKPPTLEALQRQFRGYQHVAFERHPPSMSRMVAAHVLRALRIGN